MVDQLSPEVSLDRLRECLGVAVSDSSLRLALTHSTYAYENGGGPNNERLEFLGDAVLGHVVTSLLYHQYPELSEGDLAKRRAAIVSTHPLAAVAESLDLGAHLLLGRGEELTGGRHKASLLADALEAVIGAVYLEQGFEGATSLVERLFGAAVRDPETFSAHADPKTSLQEWAAKEGLGAPHYVITDSGPDHQKVFEAHVFVAGSHPALPDDDSPVGTGVGTSKKQAEIVAARAALDLLLGG